MALIGEDVVRKQWELELARGKSPSRATAATAYRFGLKQREVREIVQTTPPATRRLTQQNQETTQS